MLQRIDKIFLAVIVLILLSVVGGMAVNEWMKAAWLADQSAQAALDKEISDQLAAIGPGQSYPGSLSELKLTYPDGGDSSLLNRFEYHSMGDSCTVRTMLWDEEVVRTFRATE